MKKIMPCLLLATLPFSAHGLSLALGGAGFPGGEAGSMIEIGQVFSTSKWGDFELAWSRYTLISDFTAESSWDNYFISNGYVDSAELQDIHALSFSKKSKFDIGKLSFSVSYGPTIAHKTSHNQSGWLYLVGADEGTAEPTFVEKSFDYGIHSNFEAVLWQTDKGSLSWQLPWVRELMVNEEFIFTTGLKYSR
ncbi:hypothetical protein [Reinekea sp.]|jgi:hypothetical protein|uniref:hypothetical protein n=1 Tax=Reinekea sp. TaxID=1970455 RepID=UPI002A8300C1|nr:hypothetical protein [Reinekea sp.]